MTEVVTATATTITAALSAARRRKGMSYDDIRPIFEKHFNSIVAFLEKGKNKLEEEASKAIKRKSETSEEKAAKKHKLNEEVEVLKTHLQIVPNDEDDVYTKATPLALKVLAVDYQIHTEHNKPYYKIIRADGSHQLFLSFISMFRNFDREDLDMLWKIVQERFASSEPKNFSDDFLLNTLKSMFEKPNKKPQTEAHAKKNIMVYLKNMVGFKMDFFKGMSYDDIRPIFEKHFNSIVGFLEKGEEQLEEKANKALKRKSKSSKQQAAKKQKLNEEVEEFKTHLQIVPNHEDDVYTEATPLALKFHVVDYQIHTKNNKPYYKIIRADGTHQLFLSFISLLRNFDREDLEMLWKIVQERFASSKPKNFSDNFLLNTLKAIVLWSSHNHIYNYTDDLLVERRYHWTRFTLDQMLNNVRLEVEEESEMSLELLRFVRRQQQEGYTPDFGVDAVEDFKEYTLRDYYCWLKTYCCWYKLKLLDNTVNSRLRLLEESVTADDKMKK
nr:hypothetical protein [Tanacetum cinerariifolium]